MERITNHPVKQLGNPKSKKLLYDNSISNPKKWLIKYFEKNFKLSTMEACDRTGGVYILKDVFTNYVQKVIASKSFGQMKLKLSGPH
jgi:hypothetical protein